jgi:hypothetical protein
MTTFSEHFEPFPRTRRNDGQKVHNQNRCTWNGDGIGTNIESGKKIKIFTLMKY